jgi:hypothetical protein
MRTIQPTLDHQYAVIATNPFTRFINWCAAQETNRFAWTAVIIALHGCVLTPVTVLGILSTGNDIVLFGIAVAAMAISLATNLAAMPTRIIIPVFFLSVLVDLALLAWSVQAIL